MVPCPISGHESSYSNELTPAPAAHLTGCVFAEKMAVTGQRIRILLFVMLVESSLFLVITLSDDQVFLSEILQKENVSVPNKENSVADLRQTADVSPLLRLAPKRGISIVAPSVRSGEFITSSRLSLLTYEEKFGAGKEAIEENLKQVIAHIDSIWGALKSSKNIL